MRLPESAGGAEGVVMMIVSERLINGITCIGSPSSGRGRPRKYCSLLCCICAGGVTSVLRTFWRVAIDKLASLVLYQTLTSVALHHLFSCHHSRMELPLSPAPIVTGMNCNMEPFGWLCMPNIQSLELAFDKPTHPHPRQ